MERANVLSRSLNVWQRQFIVCILVWFLIWKIATFSVVPGVFVGILQVSLPMEPLGWVLARQRLGDGPHIRVVQQRFQIRVLNHFVRILWFLGTSRNHLLWDSIFYSVVFVILQMHRGGIQRRLRGIKLSWLVNWILNYWFVMVALNVLVAFFLILLN